MKLSRYKELESYFSKKTILVVGDLMLDNYLWGQATRISPEAPVPVVKVISTSTNPGGASNVALNLSSLGTHVIVFGLIGDDREGMILKSLLEKASIDPSGIIVDPIKPTSVKTRIFAHNQQVVRTDWEDDSPIGNEIQKRLAEKVREFLPDSDAVILEDYNKGIFTPEVISEIISLCHQFSKPVYCDPKINNFFCYQEVTLFKPNLHESSLAAGTELKTDSQIESFGLELQKRLNSALVLITRGEKGMSLFDGSGHHLISTRARRVHDVSGAGDTVIATFTVAHCCGADPVEAALLANYAAGRVCEEVGVVPITREGLTEIIDHHNS